MLKYISIINFTCVFTVIDEPFKFEISSAVDSGEIIEGNPAVLNCDVKPSVYKDFVKIIHWKSVGKNNPDSSLVWTFIN